MTTTFECPQVILTDLESCVIDLSTTSSPPPTLPLYPAKPSPKTFALLTLEITKFSIRYFAFKTPALGWVGTCAFRFLHWLKPSEHRDFPQPRASHHSRKARSMALATLRGPTVPAKSVRLYELGSTKRLIPF